MSPVAEPQAAGLLGGAPHCGEGARHRHHPLSGVHLEERRLGDGDGALARGACGRKRACAVSLAFQGRDPQLAFPYLAPRTDKTKNTTPVSSLLLTPMFLAPGLLAHRDWLLGISPGKLRWSQPWVKVGVPAFTLGGLTDRLPWDLPRSPLPTSTPGLAGLPCPVCPGIEVLPADVLPGRGHLSRRHLGCLPCGVGVAGNSWPLTVVPL